MKYIFEIGSVAMIYVPNVIIIGSDNQKMVGGIHRHRYAETVNLCFIK
jgi:hypothetical protein